MLQQVAICRHSQYKKGDLPRSPTLRRRYVFTDIQVLCRPSACLSGALLLSVTRYLLSIKITGAVDVIIYTKSNIRQDSTRHHEVLLRGIGRRHNPTQVWIVDHHQAIQSIHQRQGLSQDLQVFTQQDQVALHDQVRQAPDERATFARATTTCA